MSSAMATLALTLVLAAPMRAEEANPAAVEKPKDAAADRKDIQGVAKSYEVSSQEAQSMAGLQGQLEALAARRRALQSEQTYVDAKISWAKTKLAGRGAPDGKDETYAQEIDKWSREVKAWEARRADTQATLSKVAAEEETLLKAVAEEARGRDQTDMLIPGDMLELYVAEDDAFNGIYQVRAGGYIVIPRLPKIYVAGKTLSVVEQAIRDELGRNQLRNATVTIDRVVGQTQAPEISRDYLYITGQVKRPGPWPIPDGYEPTAVTLVLRTPLTEFADLERVQVLRLVDGRALIETINVKAIMDGAGLTPDFALKSNDIVIVPAKGTGEHDSRNVRNQGQLVYVQGNVLKPGTVRMVPPARMTVLAAIRHCEGPNRNADLTTLELIRIERERTVREILNLGAIMRGEEEDVNLVGEDILVLYGKDARVVLSPLRVYLAGNVKKPGPAEIKGEEGEVTVLQVLLHNGGYGRFADQAGVYVLRDMGNGIRNRIPVNMKKVNQGIIPDLILKDNDVVTVPERFFSF
jgi:protein involved in polysaccharide export with SLBB domain